MDGFYYLKHSWGEYVVFNNYLYKKNKRYGLKIYYKCRLRNCKVSLLLNRNVIEKLNGIHNHEDEKVEIIRLRNMELMKELVGQNVYKSVGKINEFVNHLEHERQMNEYGELKESRAIISLKSSKSILYRERKKRLAMLQKLDNDRASLESSKGIALKIDSYLGDVEHGLMNEDPVDVVNSVNSEDDIDVEGSVDIDHTMGVDNRSKVEDSHYLINVGDIPRNPEMTSKVINKVKMKKIFTVPFTSNSYADTDDDANLSSSE